MYAFLGKVVGDAMTRDVKSVSRGLRLRELGEEFQKRDFNTFPVVENSHVVGVVSKFDYLACFVFTPAHLIPQYEELMQRSVADIMTLDFIYVGVDTRLTRVLQLMVDHRIRSLPVIEGDRLPVGMISREDVMRVLKSCACGDA